MKRIEGWRYFYVNGLKIYSFLMYISTLIVLSGALMASKLKSVCDYLFFGGPMPTDKDVKNL
jgi:hypothetical protein